MIEIANHFIDFIKDKSTSLGKKATLFIFIIGFIGITDYCFNFSYNNYLNNKVEQLEKLNNLKNIYEKDSSVINEISKIENRVLNKTHYSDLLLKISFKDLLDFQKIDRNKEINTNSKNPIRSYFWMVLSSSYFFIIIFLIVFILPFTGKVHRELNNLATWIKVLIVNFLIIIFTTWISYQIPIILDRVYLNYILNFLILTIFLILIGLWSNWKKKKKTNGNTV